MLRRILKAGLTRLGYTVRARDAVELEAEESRDRMIERIRAHTMVAHLGLISLYEQVRFCELNGIKGDFVECGVWKGGSVGLMALANLEFGCTRRHLHLFDSFEEICEPEAELDGERAVDEVRDFVGAGQAAGRLVPLKGIYDSRGGPGTVEQNQHLLIDDIGYDASFVNIHKGWFQETVPETAARMDKIAILRLDGDWYASTKVCLEHLFSKVVAGGFVIIDDYGAYEGCRKAVDEFLTKLGRPLYLHYVNTDIRYLTP